MALSLAVTGLDELTGILDNLRSGASAVGGVSVGVGSALPQAAYVEYGTRPHTIAARNARALHWASAGGEFFARSVQHPGTRPIPFLERALTASEPEIVTLVADAFTVIATGGPVSAAGTAIAAAGALVAKAAQATAPVKTGALRDSIAAVVTGRLP